MGNQEGVLYVVATPIGHLADISYRAVEVLQKVSGLLVEDTRRTAVLLKHYGIKQKMTVLEVHSESRKTKSILDRLRSGESLALLSDAGTPLISDPGYLLVNALRNEGMAVVPIPGPSAMIAALSVAGLPSDRFVFEGFLPSKKQARLSRLEVLKAETRTLIFYEAPHRVLSTLQAMCQVIGPDRQVVLGRELTKIHEQILTFSLHDALQAFEQKLMPEKGEFVILLAANSDKQDENKHELDLLLSLLLKEVSLKKAVQIAVSYMKLSKAYVYKAALDLKAGKE
jgi:16S rRNA (cytidine1402-2'-O)-methyltransferase